VTVQHDDAAGRARRRAVPYTDPEQALMARLREISAASAVTPDEAFRAATRSRLVAMAAVRTSGAEATARRPSARAGVLHRLLAGGADTSRRRRTRLTAGLAGAALAVTAVGGLLAAAQGAHPGDLLYDVKRGGEQTQLALAGDSRRGVTLLGFASTRLDELRDLVGVEPHADAVVGTTPAGGEAGLAAGPDIGLVLGTLQTMDQQTTEGAAALTSRAVAQFDAGALHDLTGWAGGQQSGLGSVADAVPARAQGALAASRDLVDQVAARGTALQLALACPGGPSTAGADQLGPLPAVCPAPPPLTPGAPDPAGAPAPGSLPTRTPTGTSTDAPAAVVPGGTSGAAPSTTAPSTAVPSTAVPVVPVVPGVPGAPSGAALPTAGAPATSARPGLPLPTLPALPGIPGVPSASATPPATHTSPGAVVSLPAPSGIKLCAPPLITVGC
jgi:hypothetical protein